MGAAPRTASTECICSRRGYFQTTQSPPDPCLLTIRIEIPILRSGRSKQGPVVGAIPGSFWRESAMRSGLLYFESVPMMAQKRTGSKKSSPIESSLTAFSRKLSGSAQLKDGSILFHFTDSGEEYCVEGTGREARVTRGAPIKPPLVEVRGPSTVLRAIMDGKKEASRAFIAGGIQVQGDLPYLEALLKDIGLLQCT
jgi:hypothetical protein